MTPRTPKTSSASCTSSRPSTGTSGRRGRLFTRTSPAPQTPTTSARSSATSRTLCCSSPSGTMGSSELLLSGKKTEESGAPCLCLDYLLVWEKALLKAKMTLIFSRKKNAGLFLKPRQSDNRRSFMLLFTPSPPLPHQLLTKKQVEKGTSFYSSLTFTTITTPLSPPTHLK